MCVRPCPSPLCAQTPTAASPCRAPARDLIWRATVSQEPDCYRKENEAIDAELFHMAPEARRRLSLTSQPARGGVRLEPSRSLTALSAEVVFCGCSLSASAAPIDR